LSFDKNPTATKSGFYSAENPNFHPSGPFMALYHPFALCTFSSKPQELRAVSIIPDRTQCTLDRAQGVLRWARNEARATADDANVAVIFAAITCAIDVIRIRSAMSIRTVGSASASAGGRRQK
jgi:hypothetical protein